MTLLWLIIWLISNVVGDTESLTFDPVNWWAGTLDPGHRARLEQAARATARADSSRRMS